MGSNELLLSPDQGIQQENPHKISLLKFGPLGILVVVFISFSILCIIRRKTSQLQVVESLPLPTLPTEVPSQISPNSLSQSVNGFVYLLDYTNLWLCRIIDKKPVIKKIAEGVWNYKISPDGKKIAYVSSANRFLNLVYLENPDEKIELKIVIPESYPAVDPGGNIEVLFRGISWSPDSKRIAFVGSEDNQADIYIIDIDVKKVERLTNSKINEYSLIWSPDGKKIVFRTTSGFGSGAGHSSDIAIIDTDSLDFFQVTSDGKVDEDHRLEFDTSPIWVGNDELIFTTESLWGTNGIWKFNPAERKTTSLVTKLEGGEPIWSKEIGKLLFPLTRKVEKDSSSYLLELEDILIIDKNGLVSLVKTNGNYDQIAWLPSGKDFLYSIRLPILGGQGFTSKLFVVSADGKNLKEITPEEKISVSNFVLSPKGEIIFLIERENGDGKRSGVKELWVMDSDGNNKRQIDSSTDIYGPYIPSLANSFLYAKKIIDESGVVKYVFYWFNLDTFSEEIFTEQSNLIFPESLDFF